MKIFHCDNCHHIIYFENVQCTSCGYSLGFCPDYNKHYAFEAAGNGLWKNLGTETQGKLYRQCQNYAQQASCNWMIEASSPNAFCRSCDLDEVIPDLSKPDNVEYWRRLESAKRRLVYSLISLNLPLNNKKQDPELGLAFAFLADKEMDPLEKKPLLTGHDKGLITINISEADDAIREKMRLNMKERYRTLLGHFRHEIGHYYWMLLIQDSNLLTYFRNLFGDENADYAKALEEHYKNKMQEHWRGNFISHYASAHPWEDWAETWAHYLHMIDTLETARSWGIAIQPGKGSKQPLQQQTPFVTADAYSFDAMIESWDWLSCALNTMNRSMGLMDAYPFVLSQNAMNKLRFVHDLIQGGPARMSAQQ